MILIVTQTFAPALGGMEAYMTGLAETLTQQGHPVTVMADAGKNGWDASFPFALHRFGGWRPLRRWRKRRAVTQLAASEKIEAVFCDSWKSVEALPSRLAVPVGILAHGAEFPAFPSPRKRKRIARALATATAILPNSGFTAARLQPYLPARQAPPVTIIHPPIGVLRDPPPQAKAKIAAAVAGRGPVIAVISRLEPRKGIDRLIESLPRLTRKYPGLVLLIAGAGGDEARLRALAMDKDVADHAIFLGRADEDEKAALLAACDLFAMPVRQEGSSVEGFGIVYIEAAWYGAPSLGGRNSGAEDAVIDGETGLLCDGADAGDVAAKLDILLADAELRRAMGRKARERARNNMTWAVALPRFLGAVGIGNGA